MEIQGTVRDILKSKGSEVWTTAPDSTVYDAIGLMGEKDVGSLVVIENGEVIGVLSERDYSRQIVLRGRTSRNTLVNEILSSPVVMVHHSDSIEKCMAMMTEHHVRHLPVLNDGELAGLISMGDLVRWAMKSQQHTILQLQGYIAGEYPG